MLYYEFNSIRTYLNRNELIHCCKEAFSRQADSLLLEEENSTADFNLINGFVENLTLHHPDGEIEFPTTPMDERCEQVCLGSQSHHCLTVQKYSIPMPTRSHPF